MRKLIILAGVPGTGKSYFARTEFKNKKVHIISSDEIRYSITHDYTKLVDDMFVVYNRMIELTNEIFTQDENATVVLDSTFLTDERRNYFLDRITLADDIELILLKVHNEDLIYKRNRSRIKEKWVPEEVIARMIDSYQYPSDENAKRYQSIRVVFVDD